jgi:2-oxoisovalerate dehydrogenase E1 component alpha subunit
MQFITPATLPPIPTYQVLDSNGQLKDSNRAEPDVTEEQVLTWYQNMLTGEHLLQACEEWHV